MGQTSGLGRSAPNRRPARRLWGLGPLAPVKRNPHSGRGAVALVAASGFQVVVEENVCRLAQPGFQAGPGQAKAASMRAAPASRPRKFANFGFISKSPCLFRIKKQKPRARMKSLSRGVIFLKAFGWMDSGFRRNDERVGRRKAPSARPKWPTSPRRKPGSILTVLDDGAKSKWRLRS